VKAIILAAGRGSRLGRYTLERPKCLLELGGISLLERQIGLFRRFGIDDIVVIRGYAGDKIRVAGVRYYANPDYAQTNMVHSLFCAETEVKGEVIVSYGDILFQDSVLEALLSASPHEILVAVDTGWEEYYKARYDDPLAEAESLVCGPDGRIASIGESLPCRSEVQGQYIGLIRLTDGGSEAIRRVYREAREAYWNRLWKRGRLFQKAYMTDMLQALIDDRVPVCAVTIDHGWLEFDTARDYENVLQWLADGSLGRFYNLSAEQCEQA